MQAIILAAGMGKRLKEHTADKTKCMIEINGVTLLERSLRSLDTAGLTRIIIVCGYRREQLKQFVAELMPSLHTPISFVDNEAYETTNNIYSLGLTREQLLEDDTIVVESDIIFEQAILDKLLDSTEPCVTFVARPEPWMDGVIVTLDSQNRIAEFIEASDYRPDDFPKYYKTVSLYRFTKAFLEKTYIPFLDAYLKAWGDSQVYESALKVVALQKKPVIQAIPLRGERWYEINDIQDIEIAGTIFAEGTERLKRYLCRYGGYWRYQGLRDFCYLVNPFFPNERFMNEMKANFDTLLREYPSGMSVNSLLAAQYFELRPEQICVGNGSAELIKSLMEQLEGSIGMVYPTFEEYPHRKKPGEIVPFHVISNDFIYTVEDLMEFYGANPVQTLVLINPDNPSGHFMEHEDILRLAAWTGERQMRLIIDESFLDFADTKEYQTLLRPEILDTYPHLIVVKSISKSYGVAGLRLGVLATGDLDLIAFMKKDVSIWNINSFAEYYMQIITKYKEDYQEAMRHFVKVRDSYIEQLKKFRSLKVYPSQANYVMCKVEKEGMTASGLANLLLDRYNLLIKDLSGKEGFEHGNYIRISVKTEEENEDIIRALQEIFQENDNSR